VIPEVTTERVNCLLNSGCPGCRLVGASTGVAALSNTANSDVHEEAGSASGCASAVGAAAAADVGLGSEQPNDLARAKLRRQVSHDIRHELTTITLLAAVLSSADDVGPESRARAHQIMGETRWLDELLHAYDQGLTSRDRDLYLGEALRLDLIAGDVIATLRLSTLTRISLEASPACAYVDRLALWRALRNLVCNAVHAAGPAGIVAVRIFTTDDLATLEVDDDGPGLDRSRASTTSLGLGIVEDLVTSWGGTVAIDRGRLGGCRVRLQLRAAPETDCCSSDAAGASCVS
jgi:signal transduction histidine kinase